jgi:hypothetical protein
MMVLRDRPHGLTVDELHDELKSADVDCARNTVVNALGRLRGRGEVRAERDADRRAGRRGPAPFVWFANGLSVRELGGTLGTEPPPSWRISDAELMARLRTPQANGYRPTVRDAVEILADLERMGQVARVDATGVAISPSFAAQFGGAFKAWGGPS